MKYRDAFAYANWVLANHTVLITNSDVYPVGAGWADLSPSRFGTRPKNGIVYMLSRYGPACPGHEASKEDGEPELPPRKVFPCRTMANYGSADGFLFRSPVSAKATEAMDFPTNYWGAENKVGAILRKYGRSRLLNPCQQLSLWHEHCSRVRTQGVSMPRVNQGKGAMSATARWMPAMLP